MLSIVESYHSKDDQELVDEVLRIFDDTIEILDKRDDFRTRVLIDRLALEIISCIRWYVEARARY